MEIYCCACERKVEARLTNGSEIYPHRPDLDKLPFWKCDVCNNYVGCHHKTEKPTQPLGNIPTKELREARSHIHKILDPLWKSGEFKRAELYKTIQKKLGCKHRYHTAQIRSIEEARKVYVIIKELRKEITCAL